MAQRPVLLPTTDGLELVRTVQVAFQWFPGLSVSQKQKSVASLHAEAAKLDNVERVLEISSKSREEFGIALSAFNLKIPLKGTDAISVECAFQGSKVFERGGPYVDLFERPPWEAKRDERLRASGRLTAFRFLGEDWALQPKTAFYDWLYLTALGNHPDMAERLLAYTAFTDIEFNPARSINCQAYSAALYVALERRDLFRAAMPSQKTFLQTLKTSLSVEEAD